VAAGDFDGDGRMDLVLGNWGANFSTAGSMPGLAFGDFAGRGGVEVIETEIVPDMNAAAPAFGRGRYEAVLPWVRTRFPSYAGWGEASVEKILAGRPFTRFAANRLESGILLNRGDHFEWRPLPAPAQWSPVFGIAVADFDGDGREDVALVQNFFGTRPGVPRQDAGRGLLLLGSGDGEFTVAEDSGFDAYGEGRGLAVGDADGDGRPDLVVAQRGAPVLFWRNRSATPGLRVRLTGPPGNPSSIGASIRWSGPDPGPRRELHAGSGYWSMDSTTTVLPRRTGSAELEVRWPGGGVTRTMVPPSAAEIVLNPR
jgi:enediyne biosynthesis protein E4